MNFKKKDLIIVVIASENTNYYIKFISGYWLKLIRLVEQKYRNIKIYLVFGETPSKISIASSNLIVSNTEENIIPGVLKKTVYAFEYISKKYDYKYLLRTNLSSFFIIDNLVKLINISNKSLFTGCITKYKKKIFISGTAIWLSKSNVEYIINNKKTLNYSLYDDVSISELLKKKIKNIEEFGRRYDIIKNTKNGIENIINEIIKDNCYFIRIKTKNRNKDVVTINLLYDYFYKK